MASVIYTDEWSIFSDDRHMQTTQTWERIPNTQFDFTLLDTCDLVIIFSAECQAFPTAGARTSYSTSEDPRARSPTWYGIELTCFINTNTTELQANGPFYFVNEDDLHFHDTWRTETIVWHLSDVPSDTWTVFIDWKVSEGTTGEVWFRTLTVIANGAGHYTP